MSKRIIETPIGSIFKNMILTPDGEIFVFYRLAKLDYPLNSSTFFENYIEDGKGIFGHDEFDYKFFDIPEGYDIKQHIQKTKEKILVKTDTSYYDAYWERAGMVLKDEVQNNNYVQYLQIRLTKPTEIVDPLDFFREFQQYAKGFLKKMAGNYTKETKPLTHYENMEKLLYSDLQNYKALDRVYEDELNRIMFYNFHRTNKTLLSHASINPFNMQEGVVTNHNGYLTIEQLDKTHYVSLLPLIDTPDGLSGSGFVQILRDTLPFPIETQINVRFNKVEKDLKDVGKVRNRLFYQEKDRNQTDKPLDEDEVINHGEEILRDLQVDIKSSSARVAKSTILFILSADSLDELERRIKDLEYAIQATSFKVYRPVVDQLTLFHQSLLATPYNFKLFERNPSTGYLWELGVDLERNIGNNYGIPIGRLITQKKFRSAEEARENSSKVVWLNPTLTKKDISGAQFTNGNTMITGPPGQGKSVTIKYLFCWLPSLGQKVLYVDPKDETELFFHKALKEHSTVSEFVEFVNRINFMRLSGEEKNRGLLDPLIFLEGEEAESAARETLEVLGELENNLSSSSTKKVTIQRAIKEVVQSNEPKNLLRVIAEIRKTDAELADLIESYDNTIGRVLFGNDSTKCINFDNPITVLGIAGLKLPTKEEVEQNAKLTPIQRASQVIMENIYKLVNIFSTDKDQDAAVIFDEAAGLENTASGREKMDESAAKGRANNTDVYFVTQSGGGPFNDERKKSLISHRFVFRPNDEEAQKEALESLNLEVNEENLAVIKNLKRGTCLYQDHLGRTQPIVIDVIFDEWLAACSSTDKTSELTKNALELEQAKGA
ncbi:type VI secretion protein [Listeria sp. FSL L7-1426]|uniref:ATP-binding protein n=1 Tax=Listeria cossartiae TaxID=2838249 RepID=UPI0016279CEF|nr:ATP-binding protein [Listeria cossartiae]MBC1572762.1 type VI secretion protein [Listeria cossartiae subsp. cossartiae]